MKKHHLIHLYGGVVYEMIIPLFRDRQLIKQVACKLIYPLRLDEKPVLKKLENHWN
jgi:hypothetical protein